MNSSIIAYAKNFVGQIDSQYNVNQILLFLMRYMRSGYDFKNYSVEQLQVDASDYINWFDKHRITDDIDPLTAFASSTTVSRDVKHREISLADMGIYNKPMIDAIINDNMLEVKHLLDKYQDDYNVGELLALAAQHNNPDIVNYLLRTYIFSANQLRIAYNIAERNGYEDVSRYLLDELVM